MCIYFVIMRYEVFFTYNNDYNILVCFFSFLDRETLTSVYKDT